MGKDQNSPQGGSDVLLYFLAAIAGVVIALRVLAPWIFRLEKSWVIHHRQWLMGTCAAGVLAAVTIIAFLRNKYLAWRSKKAIFDKDPTSIFLGTDMDAGKKLHLKESFRIMHTQVIGTTNAGKTGSIVMPWIDQDMAVGRGMIIMDGKADASFLNELYSRVIRHGRKRDFMLFSLAHPYMSSTFNPFCEGTPEQITERTFSSFDFSEEYYKNIQFEALRTVITLLMHRGERPMPGVIRELLRDKKLLHSWTQGLEDPLLNKELEAMLTQSNDEFSKQYSSLVNQLGNFSSGIHARLYNTRSPEIDLAQCLRYQKICYFQLPTMLHPFLGRTTGKLVLQSIEGAISEAQVDGSGKRPLFSIYLDDFNDYLYPGFGSLLNKSRSANVGVVFSHQSLGDLTKVGDEFKDIFLTNTNIKIVMRNNDPDSAEHFAKTIGTKTAERSTSRRTRSIWGNHDTGEQSVREAEEFLFHPNTFKSGLGLGQGVAMIPHLHGTAVKKLQFTPVEAVPGIKPPVRELPELNLIQEATFRGKGEPAAAQSFTKKLGKKESALKKGGKHEKQMG